MKPSTDEIPNYRKKKPSNRSSSKRKANHKHEYQECLLISDRVHHGTYCSVCHKVGEIYFLESEPGEGPFLRLLSQDELLKKYETLPKLELEDLWQKKINPDSIPAKETQPSMESVK